MIKFTAVCEEFRIGTTFETPMFQRVFVNIVLQRIDHVLT